MRTQRLPRLLLCCGALEAVACGGADGAAPRPTPTPTPVRTGTWTLAWRDEFDGTTLDASKWNAMRRRDSYNNEKQFYLPENVVVENGLLRLVSKRESITEGGVTRAFTSGLVNTLDKFSQLYGRFVVRARLPRTRGIWPAHWMLPADNTWPPEIDIMELLGHAPTTVYMTNHWGVYPAVQRNGGQYTGPDFSQDFHTFALEWEPGVLRWFVDEIQRFTSESGVPNKPFYLILNTAVGGDWPGDPDETTVFPQYHDIDWVRVYERR
jgi:beta-glucanase (GH16 family)